MDLDSKKYMIIGAGRSGISCALFLSKRNKKVYLSDLKEFDDLKKLGFGIEKTLNDKNISLILGRAPKEEEILESGLVVISPSVPPKAPPVVFAKENKIEVMSEFEFANSFCSGYKIAITGTNGKTTTTTLMGEIFKNAGYTTYVNGNIGDAFINSAARGDKDSVYALEVSSFQLEMLDKFKPNISIITNITPDHLDRHGSFEEYTRVKGNVFLNQDKNDYLLINKEDDGVVKLSKNAKCNVLTFTSKEDENANAYLKDGNIIINYNGDRYPLLKASELKLYGLHNVRNVMACALSAIIKGIDKESLLNTLKNFKSVEHRIEYIDTVNGIDYINDSKGTNSEATMIAVMAMKKPTVLMLGGFNKGLPFDDLMEVIKNNKFIKNIVAYGDIRQKLSDCAKKHGINSIVTCDGDFYNAIDLASSLAKEDECVLLSPATSSFDMFDDYEQRGDKFREYIIKMKG